MGKYVRLDDVLKVINKYGLNKRSNTWQACGIANAITREIAELQSADVVEVVRCKDCKWWTKQKDSTQGI